MLSIRKINNILKNVQYPNFIFVVKLDDDRPYLQIESESFCNTTGDTITWKSRKWFLSFHMTKSEIVATCLKATLTAIEHEARENFKYKGKSIFDPHYDVEKLVKLRSKINCLEGRQ